MLAFEPGGALGARILGEVRDPAVAVGDDDDDFGLGDHVEAGGEGGFGGGGRGSTPSYGGGETAGAGGLFAVGGEVGAGGGDGDYGVGGHCTDD